MRYIITLIVMLGLVGCNNSDSYEVTDKNVTNGDIITLENNQTIGYKPNTDVQIVSLGEGAYYISCNEGECPVHIGDLSEDNSNSVDNNSTSN